MRSTSSSVIDANHCADGREFAIRFALWCIGLAAVPSADRIRVHWRMSRATAYRWRRAWLDATGQEAPPRQSSRRLNPAEVMRARKQAAGLARSGCPAEACRSCEFFRYVQGDLWGKCRKHVFPARPSDTCPQFCSREHPSGGNRNHRSRTPQ